MKCFLHPGRNSVFAFAGTNYCQQCKTGQEAAAAQVAQTNSHVEPKRCFVTYKGGDTWVAIPGTGCAHWVSHQLDISNGSTSNQCLEGHSFRVPDAIQGKQQVNIDDVQVRDVWANDSLTHMGLVSKVDRDADPGSVTIQITHDSSHQGGVFTNDFSTYFHGQGKFYR